MDAQVAMVKWCKMISFVFREKDTDKREDLKRDGGPLPPTKNFLKGCSSKYRNPTMGGTLVGGDKKPPKERILRINNLNI